MKGLTTLILQLSQTDPTAKVKATKPEPRDGATIGLTSVSKLEWKPGANAKSHKVYFGTKIDELLLLAEVQSPGYDELPELEEGAKYYWRVDEVWADGTVITGDVCSFTTGKLVGWWKFDETEGSNASDSSSSDNVGKLSGNPQWRPSAGKVGGALEFDGVDDFVDCGNDASLDITEQITLAAWVKTNDAGDSQFNPYVTKGDRTYGLKQHSQNTLEFVIYDGTWRVTHYPVDGSFNGVWHHLAGTYDGGKLKLYIDGTLEVTTAHAGSIASSAANLNIATNSEESGRFYNGAIDDVRIYNYALSEKEIEMLCRVKAIKPHPSDGATIVPTEMPELSWVPAIGATSHKVYGGVESNELKLLGETTESHSFELPDMQKNMKYYWRVDGILADGSIAKGDVWNLSVGKLVGWWKFDGNADDSSGNGYNGAEKGDPTYVIGKIGQAISFDGEGDYVDFGNPTSLDFGTGDWSVSAWIKTTHSGTADENENKCTVFAKGGDQIGGIRYTMAVNEVQSGMITLTTDDDVAKIQTTSSAIVNDNVWHHVVGTRNAGELRIYVDAVLDGTNTLPARYDLSGTSQHSAYVGVIMDNNIAALIKYYVGLIDDFRIYNYALSESEIKTLYNEGK